MILTVALSLTLALAASLPREDAGRLKSECFKKISAGERLIAYYVTRIVERDTVGGCEQECNIYKCTHFSFSVAFKGKRICELTTDRQISRRQDTNFDLYEKTNECVQGKPTGYEGACYRRIISGKRLHERFIRHSLPCNSLESCQHQCSIEKHFDCQGFNIRLDPQNVGRGVCELSSTTITHLDIFRDFIYDPEFVYYEKDKTNSSPNCGFYIQNTNVLQTNLLNDGIGHRNSVVGGPYYGGDSYGPWSTGFGTTDHGPWGSYGYGSGFYQSNNPLRGPTPSFHPITDYSFDDYGRKQFIDNQNQIYRGSTPSMLRWDQFLLNKNYPNYYENTYFNMKKTPAYIIVDADAKRLNKGVPKNNLMPNQVALPYYPPRYQSFIFDITNYPSPQEIPGTKSRPIFFNTKPNSEESYVRYHLGSPKDPQNSVNVPQNPFLKPQGRPGFPYYSAHPFPLPRSPAFSPPPLPSSSSSPSFSSSPSPYFFGKLPHTYSSNSNNNLNSISHKPTNHEVCFQRAHPGYKLNPLSVKGMYDTSTVLDCETMCTTSSTFKCTGYSFRYSTADKDPNCLLTDFISLARETHLLPDRSCDVYFKMTTCLDINRMSDTECFVKMASDKAIDSSKIVKSVWVGGLSDCELACLNSNFFTCRSFTFRYSSNIIGQPVENCFLSDWPVIELSHLDFVPLTSHEIYERGSYGHGCELNSGPPYIGPAFTSQFPIGTLNHNHDKEIWNIDETWRHFTVNGWPCKTGSQCKLNTQLGFWSCEIAGGDKAQWDYCCRPQHSCGYSRGYNYPWCYVGEAGQDQWRPCSEHYYPDFENRYPYKPVHLPPDFSLGPPRDERPPGVGDSLGPPTFWPISYFYAEPPPNITYWDDSGNSHHHHHHHHHYHYHYPDDILEHLHSPNLQEDDNRSIKFKSCSPKFPYPRAIIQKLDIKKEVEGEYSKDHTIEMEKSENSRSPNKVNSEHEKKEILLTSKLKKKQVFSAYTSLPLNDTEKYSLSTEELEMTEPINNTREFINAVEQITKETSNEGNLKVMKNGTTNNNSAL